MTPTRVRIKSQANLDGDKQSYRNSKGPRRPPRQLPSTGANNIKSSALTSRGCYLRDLFGGRPAISVCTQARNQLTEQSWGIEA